MECSVSHTVRPLVVEEKLEHDTLNVTVRLNKLCSEESYTVLVAFGTRPETGGGCTAQVNATTATLSPGDSAHFSVDSASLSLAANQAYCYTINGFSTDEAGPATGDGGGGGEGREGGGGEGISTTVVVVLTLVVTMLVILPVGVVIGCCGGMWWVMKRGGGGGGVEKREMGAIYEEPVAAVETAIPLSHNQAYGHISPHTHT